MAAAVKAALYAYFHNLFLAVDQLANTVIMGRGFVGCCVSTATSPSFGSVGTFGGGAATSALKFLVQIAPPIRGYDWRKSIRVL